MQSSCTGCALQSVSTCQALQCDTATLAVWLCGAAELPPELALNGEPLAGETCLRDYGEPVAPYNWMWLEFHLEKVRPRKGYNTLAIKLDGIAEGLISPLRIEDVEVNINYGSYPSGL